MPTLVTTTLWMPLKGKKNVKGGLGFELGCCKANS